VRVCVSVCQCVSVCESVWEWVLVCESECKCVWVCEKEIVLEMRANVNSWIPIKFRIKFVMSHFNKKIFKKTSFENNKKVLNSGSQPFFVHARTLNQKRNANRVTLVSCEKVFTTILLILLVKSKDLILMKFLRFHTNPCGFAHPWFGTASLKYIKNNFFSFIHSFEKENSYIFDRSKWNKNILLLFLLIFFTPAPLTIKWFADN